MIDDDNHVHDDGHDNEIVSAASLLLISLIILGLQIFRKFNISWNFPEISGNFRRFPEMIAEAWKL